MMWVRMTQTNMAQVGTGINSHNTNVFNLFLTKVIKAGFLLRLILKDVLITIKGLKVISA